MDTLRWLVAGLAVAGVTGSAAAGDTPGGLTLPLAITVEAGKHPRGDVPVMVALPAAPGKTALRLVETTGGGTRPVPSQLEPSNPPRLWWVVSGATPAGGK